MHQPEAAAFISPPRKGWVGTGEETEPASAATPISRYAGLFHPLLSKAGSAPRILLAMGYSSPPPSARLPTAQNTPRGGSHAVSDERAALFCAPSPVHEQ